MALLSAAAILGTAAGALAPIAQGAPPKLVTYGSFNPSTPTAAGVAVDQSSNDVYVTGLLDVSTFAPGHVSKLDASAKLLSPPSPFGEAYDSGAAVDPVNGDVYVLSEPSFFSSATINSYDPSTGAQISSFTVNPSRNFFIFTVVQLATDSSGNVYVPNVPNNDIEEFSSTGVPLNTFAGSGASALSGPTGVAVDSSGNVWVADAGNNRIEEFGATGGVEAEIKSEGVMAVAVDGHGNVFAVVENSADFCGSVAPPCTHLVEYSSAGTQVADIGAGSIGREADKFPSTVALNDSTDRVYVTDPLKELVWIYGPPTAPVIDSELATEVTTSEAKLGALVNPGGIATSYRVEYGATAAYGQTTPFPEGSAGEGVVSRTVWAAASGLAPGTTYHYRVVATNELGTAVGPDQTFTTETSQQAGCPNEALRGGFAGGLPDCRAYELATPPTKLSTQPDENFFGPIGTAAADGSRIAFFSAEVLPGSQSGGYNYISTRGEVGWSTENSTPRQSYTGDRCIDADSTTFAYTPSLTTGVLDVGGDQNRVELPGGCGAEGVEVVAGEPAGVKNLLLRDNTTGKYQLINATPPNVTPADAQFQGASADLSTVIFKENATLAQGAPPGAEDLYEWNRGTLRLVTFLPDGKPTVGSLAATWAPRPRVISSDGSHVFFTAGGDLYVRVNGASTVRLDVSQAGGSGGGGEFKDASADGSRVFFTDDASAGLTNDTVAGSGSNLYLYEKGRLTNLTPGGHAEVEDVDGTSADGSYVYFVARGSLAAGARQGQPNLYLWHGSSLTLIATLGNGIDSRDSTRVSPGGTFFAFTAATSPTGYDNTDSVTGFADPEIFLYDARSNRLTCASCQPSGEAPSAGGAYIKGLEGAGTTGRRNLSDDGQLFFDTREALLPRDTNGQGDVYEFENGQQRLLSTGTSASESAFVDASESGDDVFLLTRQKLVPQDTNEEALSIYDARVNGGFASVVSPPPCTTADACRAPVSPQPTLYGAPSTQTIISAGNVTASSKAVPKKKRKMHRRHACKRLRNKHKRAVCKARHRRHKTKSHRRSK